MTAPAIPIPWNAELHDALTKADAGQLEVVFDYPSADQEPGGCVKALATAEPQWQRLSPDIRHGAIEANYLGLIEPDERPGWNPPGRYRCRLTRAGRHVLGVWRDAANRALSQHYGQVAP